MRQTHKGALLLRCQEWERGSNRARMRARRLSGTVRPARRPSGALECLDASTMLALVAPVARPCGRDVLSRAARRRVKLRWRDPIELS